MVRNSLRYSSKKHLGRIAAAMRAIYTAPTVEAAETLDITSSEGLSELTRTLHSAGIDLALAEVRQPVIAATRRTGLLATIGEDHLYLTIGVAVDGLDAHRSDREGG